MTYPYLTKKEWEEADLEFDKLEAEVEEMCRTSFVIGGGISGLIWQFYNPEFNIISPDLGGFYAKMNLVWLHDTSYTRKLLTDLKITVIPKKSYIGYWSSGWIYDYQTDYLNEEVIKRKMTPWNEEVKNVEIKTRDLSLSTVGGHNYMNTLDVDLSEVINRLSKNSRILNGKVTKITKDYLVLDTGKEMPYSKLISTMPAPFFWKAYGDIKKDFKCVPITSVIVSKMPKWFDNEYEMVYYTKEVPFSRISHLQGRWALEYTGVITKEEFEKQNPDLPVLDIIVVKQGRIWENENESPQENIIFSGRFSQWKHKVVTETVLAQAINYQINKINAQPQVNS